MSGLSLEVSLLPQHHTITRMPRDAKAQGRRRGSLLYRLRPGTRTGGAAGRPWGTSVPCLSEGGGIFRAVLSRCWTRGPASTGGREIPVPPALRGQSSEGGPESLVSSPGAGTADPGGKAPALISASTSCAFKFDSQAAALFVFFLSLCGSGGREGYRQ